MSTALERNSRSGVDPAGFARAVPPVPAQALPEAAAAPAGRGFPPVPGTGDSASCSSSVGRNSDCSSSSSHGGGSDGSDEADSGEPEVQSALRGPLDTMDALGDSLPLTQGISRFYTGKSKSFTSLADVSSSSSAEDLAKPENAYPRKRKNLPAFCSGWERRHSDPVRGSGGSTPKRLANSSRTTLSPVCGMSSSNSSIAEEEEEHELSRRCPPWHPNSKISPPHCSTSPPQRCYFSVRSFSLTDLHGASTRSCSSSSSSPRGMVERIH